MMMMTSFFLTAVLLVSIGQHGPNHLKSASWKRNLFSRATRMAMITATPNEEITKTKVAVVGSGAVGGYYGSRLWEAGYNTFFHMRGEHLETSRVKGLLVTSVNGDIHIPPEKLQAFASTKDIGPVDWVIVALKSSSLEAIPELVYPLLHQDTRIVVIMNGLIEEDLLVMLSEKAGENPPLDSNISYCAAVYGGMALICSNRVAPGHIDHSYAGLLTGGLAAASNSDEGKNEEAFKQLWEPTEVDIAYDLSLLRGRWKKNLWNLPFNGISVAMGGITIDLIVNDPGLRQLAYAVMDETIAIANAELSYHGYDESWHLGEAEKKAMMELSDGMGPYKTSTMLDLVQGCRMEVRYLFREALNRANRLGIPAAHLETLVIMIEAIQKNRGL